jgi:hypothetical protein
VGGVSYLATFEGGELNGWSASLGRTPTLLRGVRGEGGRLDCLNDLGDEPSLTEEVVGVYVLASERPGFICVRGAGGGCTTTVRYVHLPVLGVAELGDEDAWVEYVAAALHTTRAVVEAGRASERTT